MTEEPNALTVIRSGRWRVTAPNFLCVVAAFVGLIDVVTTFYILRSDSFREFNRALATLAEIHIGLAVGSHLAFVLLLVLICYLTIGWLSTMAGWFVIIGIGTAGINNLIGVLIGVWPATLLSIEMWIVAHYGLPTVGFVVGTAIAYWQYRTVPIREVVIVGVILFAITTVPPIVI